MNGAPWTRRDGGARLSSDRVRVAGSVHAGLEFRFEGRRGCWTLAGDMAFAAASGRVDRVAVRIELPDDYPHREPRAFDVSGRFVHDADGHFYSTGECCLWLDWESPWNGHDPDALLGFLDHVAVFFHRQLVFEAGGRRRWPGPERSHGFAGCREYLEEALGATGAALQGLLPALEQYGTFRRFGPCPCGSGEAYRGCHLERVETTIRRVGRSRLERRLAEWRRRGYPGLPGLPPRQGLQNGNEGSHA